MNVIEGVWEGGDTLRTDMLIRCGESTRRGIRTFAGDTGDPVNLRDWTGVFAMAGPDGTIWYSQGLVMTGDGWAILDIPPGTFEDDVWNARVSGSWTMAGTAPDRHVERFGEGYWHLA